MKTNLDHSIQDISSQSQTGVQSTKYDTSTQASQVTDEKYTQIQNDTDNKTSQAFGIDTKCTQMLISHDAQTQAKVINWFTSEN